MGSLSLINFYLLESHLLFKFLYSCCKRWIIVSQNHKFLSCSWWFILDSLKFTFQFLYQIFFFLLSFLIFSFDTWFNSSYFLSFHFLHLDRSVMNLRFLLFSNFSNLFIILLFDELKLILICNNLLFLVLCMIRNILNLIFEFLDLFLILFCQFFNVIFLWFQILGCNLKFLEKWTSFSR